MNLILILGIVAAAAMFIFWTGFRNWVGRQLAAAWGLITLYMPTVATFLAGAFATLVRVVGLYSLVLGLVSASALVLMSIALLIGSPGITAFVFAASLGLILLAWLPAGIVLRLFRVNNAVVPPAIKTFIAWVAFVGFLGIIFPDMLTIKSLCGAALVGLIALSITAKMNVIDKIIFPFVLVICTFIGWQYFFPENFRSTTRYVVSWDKRFDTKKDRGSIDNETDAATTYAVVLKDVSVVYVIDDTKTTPTEEEIALKEKLCSLAKGTIVRIVSHKKEVRIIDGQGFVNIQLAKNSGSFVGGKKVWIESEFVQVASPRDIVPEDDSLLPKNKKNGSIDATPVCSPASPIAGPLMLKKGRYVYNLKAGEETPLFGVEDQKNKLSFSSPTFDYRVYFSDNTSYPGGSNVAIPDKCNIYCHIKVFSDQYLTIVVS